MDSANSKPGKGVVQGSRSELCAGSAGSAWNRVKSPIGLAFFSGFGELDKAKRRTRLFDNQQVSARVPRDTRVPRMVLGRRNLMRTVHPAPNVRMISPSQQIVQIIFPNA